MAVTQWPAAALIACIRGYRALLSPALHTLLGPLAGCRFSPSCSLYALGCLQTHPLPRALGLIARRILRCHPWHPGGEDPVPPRTPAGGGA